MHFKRFIPVLLLLLLVLFAVGCGAGRRGGTVKASPEGIYHRANQEYQKGRYTQAIEYFQKLTDEYPLSELAVLAKIGIGDSHFSIKEYPEAARVYNEFIFLHPNNEYLPYAMYQLGLCHYNQLQEIDRDQTETLKAKIQFESLITRFPESKFSFLAQKHLKESNKRLAEREFYVGLYYFDRKNFQAAIKRFELIKRDYPNVGLDHKVDYYLEQTRKHLTAQDTKGAGP